MTDYRQANFADLQGQYWDRGRAVGAVKMLRGARAGDRSLDLGHLLRHHREAAVSDAETYERDSFDFLLAHYGRLEIASLIGYVPAAFPKAFRDESLWILSHDSVRRYYEVHYPVLLPRLFRLRLEGKLSLHEKDEEQAIHPLYLRFLGMVNHLMEDEEVELFQWFLDSGWSGGANIEDTLKLLQDARGTMNALVTDPAKRSTPEKSVSGAQKFLTFCGEFEDLLKEAEAFPLFQSAMWTYYSYWFGLIGTEVGGRLGRILDTLLAWSSNDSEAEIESRRNENDIRVTRFWSSFDENTPAVKVTEELGRLREDMDKQDLKPDRKAIREYVTSSRTALDRLLSGTYGHALQKAAATT